MQDITRGRDMVDSLFQGFGAGVGGTHNAVLSSTEYLSTAMRTLGNIEDGFYIAPGKAALAWGVLASRPKAGPPGNWEEESCCPFAGWRPNACVAAHPPPYPPCPCPICSLPGQALHVSVQGGSLQGAEPAPLREEGAELQAACAASRGERCCRCKLFDHPLLPASV